MKLAIFGATGGVGRHVVRQALEQGHSVRALVRNASRAALPLAVEITPGHVLDSSAVGRVIDGADAVVSCLGSNLAATFTRRGRIVAPGVSEIIEAMHWHGVRRLVAISTYGAGDSWGRLAPGARLMMRAVLWGEVADKNAMESAIRGSLLDWTIARPVNLKDAPPRGPIVVAHGRVGLSDWISRDDVASFLLAALGQPGTIGHAFLVESTDKQ